MSDMLVNLLSLPSLTEEIERMRELDIIVRRPMPHEISKVCAFVRENFSQSWADEITVGFHNKPVSLHIAIYKGGILGFGAYECTARAFFGPTGVAEKERNRGIGRSLLIACLWGLREMGYVYGIIGGAGPTDFYRKTVKAIEIEGSAPGIFANPLS